ncbi:lipopolysaccharide biosynthesis protein [filamentous cyanobacterium CCP1]|nr:lipopolysaccharide biosynthesis protein [filamentous cyanobacterium CCP2]PSB66915.1 lipopolysaccharide biosynthesis protein [filamentous cyanobacterium CCP1]
MAKSDHHFETTTLQANLKQRSLQSGLVAIAAQPVKLVIGIVGTMVLARLLAPADFGLLAMVQPLLSMVDSLSNLGLETATVQRQSLNQEQANAIFWVSLKVNTLVLVGMVLCGPLLARFYGQPELTNIVLCLAIGVASLCLSFQHLSLLKRQMKFELLTTIEVVALTVSAGVAIATAWLGWGYWALVIQLTTLQVIKGIAYWIFCDWRPQFAASSAQTKTDLRSTLSYGLHLTGFRCISRLGMKLDRILVGYFGGASALGFYSMAYHWAYFPFWQLYHPLFDVAVSSFSRSLSEPERYRAYCRRGFMLIFAVCMPALAFLFVTAQQVTLFMLGDQWLEIVPMFRVLLIAVFVGGMYRVTKWIYVSSGETQRQFRWSLIHTPVMIAAVAIGSQWGAIGVASGYAVAICLLSYPAVVYCVQTSPITLGDFMGAIWRPAIASILSAAFLYFVQFILPTSDLLILQLSLSGLVYTVFYGCIWLILPGGFVEAKALLTILVKRKL